MQVHTKAPTDFPNNAKMTDVLIKTSDKYVYEEFPEVFEDL